MVANPADLVQPRGEDPDAYKARRSVVLESYRKGDATGTRYTNPDQGMITEIGR
jgi:type IV pilus biogenesis protein CpaD/CtpE